MTRDEVADYFIETCETLLSLQLISNYKRPKDALAIIEANKIAAGYVFGFHDSFVCKWPASGSVDTRLS